MEKTINKILRLYKEYNVEAQERFSQNFLIDDTKIDEIINSLPLNDIEQIVEIGPGLGSLTSKLITLGKEVVAIDVDRDMINVLSKEFNEAKNLKIIQENFLNTDLNVFHVKHVSYIGNLPYSITSKIIKKVVSDDEFVSFNFMVQKELVSKLIFKESSTNNNALSTYIALRGDLHIVTELNPGMFYPPPKVYSTFLRFDLKNNFYNSDAYKVIEDVFKTPRKNIMNNIKNSSLKITKEDLDKLHISSLKRPHELTLEEIKKIVALNDVYNVEVKE